MTRVIGPPKSRRRNWTLLWCLLIAVGVGVFYIPGALAVHDTGLFQLDGNATTADHGSPASTGTDDWDRVCHQVLGGGCGTSNTTGGGSGATGVDWTAEPNLSSSIFTGGGSKDPQDISQWAWKDGAGGLPDKDNLLHEFAARYAVPSNANCPGANGDTSGATNCDVLFFGSDRFDNSGDAQQGFWFFQNKIGLGTASVGGGTAFSGVHKNGDLLVISDFSNGGTTSTITVYKWNSAVNGNLELLQTSTNAKCSSAGPADAFCGIVNSGTITMPWSFTDKSGTPTNQALNGEFYEGGINLSSFNLGGECFASVAAETRSSTSTTATLKDFVLGGFGDCSTTFATTPSGDTTLSGVTGSATVSDTASLAVSGTTNPPAPTGNVDFYLCGPSATQLTSCVASGSPTKTADLANATKSGSTYSVGSGNVAVTASGYYCWFATWAGDTHYTAGPYTDGSSTECFKVTQPTSVSTTLHETNGSGVDVSPANNGTTITIDNNGHVTDYATVLPSGATGNVVFRYFTDPTVCTNATAAGGTSAGSGDVSGGSAHGSELQLASGTYYFRAFFTGTTGSLFLNSSSDCGEILVVNQVTSVSTTLHETNGSGVDVSPANNGTTITINSGSSMVDYATVVPPGATGTVVFRYFTDQTVCTNATSTGGTSAGSGSVSGGSAHGSTLTLAAGVYYFRAFFTGSGLFLNSSSDCGEILTVSQFQPSLTSAQTVRITDSATISVSGGGSLSGTAHFRPYGDAGCSTTPLAAQEDIAVSGASPQPASATTIVTFNTAGAHAVYWQVSYTSNNAAQKDIAAVCTESTTLTVTN